jgi:hypothetical protein
MKKVICSAVLLLCVNLLYSLPNQGIAKEQPTELSVDMGFRALFPGEIIKIALRNRTDVLKAHVHFSDKKHQMGKGSNPAEWLAFIGLDLGMEAGTYPVEISVLYADGSHENVNREIKILSKTFPVKKLWVKQEFVTPPPEVQDRIKTEAAILKDVFSIYTVEWLGNGGFIIPTDGEVNPNFGERRIFNNKPRSSHSGVDISSPLRTTVRASNAGRIVLAHNLYFAGKTVIIDHGLGVFSLYCHFSKIGTTAGVFVKKGEVIGEVGATGRVTGPHLHWGIKVSGSRIDPFSLLSLNLD